MGEIKFRGYAVEEMLNNQWQYGTGIYRTVFAEDLAEELGQSEGTFIWTDSGWVQIVEGSQSQYIGLKDVNGKEIYEGDIVKCFNSNNSLVCSRMYAYGLYTKGRGFEPFYNIYGQCEIIGNIHENPELLEK